MTNVDITDSKIAHKSKKKSRTQALTESLLRDRAERAARKAVRSITKIERGDFDAFEATRWRVIAGRNPGYLVATPMRRRSVGWFVACDHCGAEFESKGWKYCSACIDLPAEERRSKPAPSDRPCQRCGRPIPLRRRADAKYHSEKCAKAAENARGYRYSARTPNSGGIRAKFFNKIKGRKTSSLVRTIIPSTSSAGTNSRWHHHARMACHEGNLARAPPVPARV